MTVMPSPEGIIRAFGGASFTTPVNIELAMALNAHAWADLDRPLSRRTDHEGDWPDSCAAIEHEGRARVGQESGRFARSAIQCQAVLAWRHAAMQILKRHRCSAVSRAIW